MITYNPTYKAIVKDYATDEILSTDWVDELDLPFYAETQRARFANRKISITLIP